ncbi:Aste57867_20798 [Aphanomyces stellatus]|uniref:Aste57867_20798 protein n=1 Tax=Aphanomyces stellatus TaxID=120398 RepID=A0A485LFV1_9STRA|nr:hypothetical protein As57867_020730 [Aphanomyces stellatus]VFT97477.1 Aste57867_20798 [Aphanomyces stellatus]
MLLAGSTMECKSELRTAVPPGGLRPRRKTTKANNQIQLDEIVMENSVDPVVDESADAMILQYFMDFTDDTSCIASHSGNPAAAQPEMPSPPKEGEDMDEAALQRLKEKQNKHRLNNIRHRQRKQSENDSLRQEVVGLEVKLKSLQTASASRLEAGRRDEAAIHLCKEMSLAQKRKRDEVEEEHAVLANAVQSQGELIQLYFKRITATHCNQSNHVILENEPFLMYTLMGCRDVRRNGYEWIMTQMRRRLDVALTYLHSYVGNHIEEDTKIYLGENTVDLVRNHTWNFPVLQVAQSSWESFTRVNNSDPNASRQTTRLEEIDPNTFYTRIKIEDGIIPGSALTLNMLQRRFMDGDRAIISFRTISEDSQFPLDSNGLCDLSVAGWLSFEPNPDGTTHARVFVKFRTDHSNGEEAQADVLATENALAARPNRKTQANQWIMSVISRMFTSINGRARQSLRAPPPATTSLTVLKKLESSHGALRET